MVFLEVQIARIFRRLFNSILIFDTGNTLFNSTEFECRFNKIVNLNRRLPLFEWEKEHFSRHFLTVCGSGKSTCTNRRALHFAEIIALM